MPSSGAQPQPLDTPNPPAHSSSSPVAPNTSALSFLPSLHHLDTHLSTPSSASSPSAPSLHPRIPYLGLITEVVRPGGQVLFYEHCLSDREDVGWWQSFWTPFWRAVFGGCCLDRPTQRWIEDVGGWAEGEGVWDTNGEMEEHLFFYRAGRFVKAG